MSGDSEGRRLGVVVGGSLTKGIEVRLDDGRSVEEMAVGRYVVVQGQQQRFFGMITNVVLDVAHPGIAGASADAEDAFVREVLAGTAAYGKLEVMPLLSLGPDGEPRPVKTIPPHYAAVGDAAKDDVARIFGADGEHHFHIGQPLDMDIAVCLNYDRFIERSNGVFGKTGTGKTFLTRLLLGSVIAKSEAQRDPRRRSVNLVFDMHNEYGWQSESEGGGKVKGLKQLFPGRVVVYTVDPESSTRRKTSFDGPVEIGYADIQPDDLAVLRETLNLSELAVEATHSLRDKYGQKHWLRETMALDATSDDGKEELDGTTSDGRKVLQELNIAPGTFTNLRRALGRLKRLPFVCEETKANSVERVLQHLLGGQNVVLEFGRHGDNLAAYMLVANVLTRRIHAQYRVRTESAIGDESLKPNRLLITIEEAHKFLSPGVASQTIFGEIAREMRKYNVTLLVVDQRPSGIEEEILSQIGTKIACLLDNDKDVDAVLSGISGRSELRSVLARLETRQQALIFGHAVPMPVVVRTEEYGPATYARLTGAPDDGRSLLDRLNDGEEQW